VENFLDGQKEQNGHKQALDDSGALFTCRFVVVGKGGRSQ